MKPSTSDLAAAAAMLVLAQSCVAAGELLASQSELPGPAARPPAFRALDTDSDGVVSSGEIAGAAESLISLDADGDGQLSSGELRPGQRVLFGAPSDAPEGTSIVTLDARGGAVELSELPPQFQEFLSTADTDGDGTATAADILALMTAQRGTLPPRPGSALVATLDADGDGTISASEIASAPQSLRTLDSDGDGTLKSDELLPTPASPPE